MTTARQHKLCEQLLAEALRDEDPVTALHTAASRPEISQELRKVLCTVDPDGLRMTALLVARLRFERLLQGSELAATWFDRDPESFTQAFRTYHRQVPLRAFFPREEARTFARWYRSVR